MSRLRQLGAAAWRAPFVVHLCVYVVLLVVVVARGGADTSASSDEGAYLVQARALDRGSWVVVYPQAAADPEYAHYPFINADVRTVGGYLFPGRPVYPWLLSQTTSVLGESLGAHLLSMLGAIGAAAVAWSLGAMFDPRLRRTMFWLVALGPPLINAGFVWAHALSAALGGLAVLGMVGLMRDRSLRWAAPALAVGCVGGVLVRTEGALLVITVMVALLVTLARRRELGRVALVGAIGVASVGAALAQRAWASHLEEGAVVAAARPTDGGGGRFNGIVHDVLLTSFFEDRAELLGLLAVLFLTLGVALLARGGPSRQRDARVALVVAAVAVVVRCIVVPDDISTGLLYGWPIATVALAATRWRDLNDVERSIAATIVGFTALLALTDYDAGGGFQWAGRYLSPITVPIALFAAIAATRTLEP
ncbi:MAG: hypothetical protein QOE63_1166, partial [Acidimicrobiaceae bacterium]